MADFSGAAGQNLAEDTLWDAAGDVAYGTGSDTGAVLTIGNACQVLVVACSLPSWGTAPQSTAALDIGTENITSGGTWSVDVDATGTDGSDLYSAGTLRFGLSQDLRIYHGGTNNYITGISGDLVLTTDCDGNGIILDAEDDTVEIKYSGATGATFGTGGLCIVSGDAYSIAGTSVLNATTLGTAVVTSSLTTVGALDSGSITCGFTSIDVGSGAISTTGAITGGSLVADNLTINCCTVTATGAFTVDATTDIVLDADGDNITFKAGSGDSTGLDFSNSSGTWTVKAGTSNSDLIFSVNDGGVTNKVMTLDGGDSVIYIGGNATKAGELRILEDTDAGTDYVAITTGNLSASYTLTLPADNGCCGEVLTTDGCGALTWAASTGCPRSVAGDTDNGIITWVTSNNTFAAEANLTWDGSTLTVTGDLAVTGACITLTGAATDIDLVDNNASALSFDATGAAGLIVIDTRNCAEGVTMSGTLGVTGAVTATAGITVGSAGSGADVTFHSATSGDNFLWDSSCEKLVITGTACQVALCVADGNVLIADTLYFFDAGGEHISSNGSVLTITGTVNLGTALDTAYGGTGLTCLTTGSVMIGAGTSDVALVDMATKGDLLISAMMVGRLR